MHHIGSPCVSARSFFLLHRHEELQHPLFMGRSHAARVHLQGEEKERFNEIKQELSQISTKFSNNLLVSCIFAAAHVLMACCRRCVDVSHPCSWMSIPDDPSALCTQSSPVLAQDATKAFKKLIKDKKDIDGLPDFALALAAQQVWQCTFICCPARTLP